ncbi:hypothetical protein DPMN_119056 [Dreissena polymorpha]|uniref:Uncharacterized protein n=1 Tax=Dreissena polymorpha TaxID=45954 RepID=A0A9D4JQW3_DREPO|nr:hypothetical protein DPMN_119056 [Dreissena polymorpha]
MARRSSFCGVPTPLAGSRGLAAARIRVLWARGARNQLRARLERQKQHRQGLSDRDRNSVLRPTCDYHEHLLRADHQNDKGT